jgi:hypothetical protein
VTAALAATNACSGDDPGSATGLDASDASEGRGEAGDGSDERGGTGGRMAMPGGAGGVPVTTGGHTAMSDAGGRHAQGSGGSRRDASALDGAPPDVSSPEAGQPDAGLVDAHSDTGTPDARSDASSSLGCIPIVPGDGGEWANVVNQACIRVPSCGGPSCFARCENGIPCAYGCCATTLSSFTLYGIGAGSTWTFSEMRAPYQWQAVGKSGGDVPAYTWGDATGQRGDTAIPDPLFAAADAAYLSGVGRLRLATVPSGQFVHVAYTIGDSAFGPVPIRYGVLYGGSGGIPGGQPYRDLETLPWKASGTDIDLELDYASQPLILTASALYHRTASGWQIERTPCGDAYRDLVVDSTGAWYFLMERSGSTMLARHSYRKGWSLTELPVRGYVRLAPGDDTAHVAWADDSGLHVSWRSGNTWQTQTVLEYSTADTPRAIHGINTFDFDLDWCGSPHFVVAANSYDASLGKDVFADHYIRWTEAGWRELPMPLGCNEPSAPEISVACCTNDVVFATNNCGGRITTFPLDGVVLP